MSPYNIFILFFLLYFCHVESYLKEDLLLISSFSSQVIVVVDFNCFSSQVIVVVDFNCFSSQLIVVVDFNCFSKQGDCCC